MSDEKTYTLVFLLRSDERDPTEDVKSAITKQREKLTCDFERLAYGAVRTTLTGVAEVVDAAHENLNKDVCRSYAFARLRDDLGQELRQQAYPTLAFVEESLRAFINEALISVIGFDWWESIALDRVRDRVAQVEQRNRGRGIPHHPIEYSEFEHLVDLVTADLGYWKAEQPITAGQFQELLAVGATLEDLKQTLSERMERRSLWDSVFSKQFENEEQWHHAKQHLTEKLIPLRNKVMHHRPVRIYEIRQLSESRTLIENALKGKRRQLATADAEKLRARMAEIAETFRVQNEYLMRIAQPIYQQHMQLQSALQPFALHRDQLQQLVAAVETAQRAIRASGLEPLEIARRMRENASFAEFRPDSKQEPEK